MNLEPFGSVRSRGQPLIAMLGILVAWIAFRLLMIEAPAPEFTSSELQLRDKFTGAFGSRPTHTIDDLPSLARPGASISSASSENPARPFAFERSSPPSYDLAAAELHPSGVKLDSATPKVSRRSDDRGAGLLSADPRAVTKRRGRRASGDAWLFLRGGGGIGDAAGTLAPGYGGSQAGAVLRFNLSVRASHRPVIYVRAVRALATARESDLVAGFAARPLAGVPLAANVEVRASQRTTGVEVRPAAFIAAGIDDVELVQGFTVRGYAQAGYVGGRDATAFADGSLIAERPVWRDREAVLTAGAGAWGGAQRGAARLDLGPSASLRFRLGEGTARVSADYRLRIAGNAEPAAGAALTLSAGF